MFMFGVYFWITGRTTPTTTATTNVVTLAAPVVDLTFKGVVVVVVAVTSLPPLLRQRL